MGIFHRKMVKQSVQRLSLWSANGALHLVQNELHFCKVLAIIANSATFLANWIITRGNRKINKKTTLMVGITLNFLLSHRIQNSYGIMSSTWVEIKSDLPEPWCTWANWGEWMLSPFQMKLGEQHQNWSEACQVALCSDIYPRLKQENSWSLSANEYRFSYIVRMMLAVESIKGLTAEKLSMRIFIPGHPVFLRWLLC